MMTPFQLAHCGFTTTFYVYISVQCSMVFRYEVFSVPNLGATRLKLLIYP